MAGGKPNDDDAGARRGPAGTSPGDDRAPHDGKAPDGKPRRRLRDRPLLILGLGLAVVAVIAGGLLFWLNARQYQSTDDAFVDAHMVRLAPQIAGRVTQVLVNDNQPVTAGQLLVVLDSADLRARVDQAEAQAAQAKSQVEGARAQIAVNRAAYQQALADAAAAGAQADNAARDLARYRTLQATNPAALAPQQYDQAQTAARQTAAQRDAAVRAARSRAAQITAAKTQAAAGEHQAQAAAAQLQDASINFGYTRLVAPVSGHIAQRTVAPGAYAQPGTQLMAIVPTDVWVTANFKETQLAHMRPGQRVRIRVDACAGEAIWGHVDSIQRGAGQAFGILPPENATGNFVKVVQRVPVKIVFDNPPKDCPLGPGMSVEPRVKVR
jgi:membrane fusion protein (multidrug efflux system)